MAQLRKMECQLVIKSSADKFYDAFRSKAQLLPKMSNGLMTDVKLLHGDWNSVGAIRLWSYPSDQGKTELLKEMFEGVDDKNKTIVFKMMEGELFNYYKSWRTIFKVTPMGEGSLVKWTLEFEKLDDNIPGPEKYVDFLITMGKNIDAYLLNA